MATLSSPHLILLHRLILLRSRPYPFLRSLLFPQSKRALTPTLHTTPFPSPFPTRRLFSSHAPPPHSLPAFDSDVVVSAANKNITESENETEQFPSDDAVSVEEIELQNDEEDDSAIADADDVVVSSEGLIGNSAVYGAAKAPAPSLSVKEKKDLASYAHSLGKKLKSQQVGKSGVTDTVVMALGETLEKRELLKLKIHGNCPGELEDVVKELEKATGSVVVGQIGRTVILYRPSLTKLEAEEKKKQAQKVYLKRQSAYRQSTQSRRPASVAGQEPMQYGRGRRGPIRSGAL